jgi:hypothetical protein
MNKVLVDRKLLERVLNASWGSETVNALDDLRGFLEDATPDPIPDAEQPRAMVVPDGWQWVPVEPTPEMIQADPYGMGYGRIHAVWSRLLAAAPAPGDSQ